MQEIIDLTKDLIRFKSIQANPEELNRCIDYIETFLKNNHIAYRRLHHRQTPSILVAPQDKTVPLFMGGDSPYLKLLLDIVPGTRVDFEHGTRDARHHSQYGMQDIVWGADGEMSQHSSGEHLVVASVYKLYEILDKFMQNIAESGV